MKPKLEISHENRYVTYVERDGCMCIKMNIRGRRAYPDRLTIYPKGSFFIEFKKTDTDLERLQSHIHKELRSLGYNVYTAHSFEEAKKIYNKQRYKVP